MRENTDNIVKVVENIECSKPSYLQKRFVPQEADLAAAFPLRSETRFRNDNLWAHGGPCDAQSKWVAKTFDQHHAAEVGQMPLVERKTQCSQALWHGPKTENATFGSLTQTPLLVGFVSNCPECARTLLA